MTNKEKVVCAGSVLVFLVAVFIMNLTVWNETVSWLTNEFMEANNGFLVRGANQSGE